MSNETHPDLFGGETPIVKGSQRDQRSGQPFKSCKECSHYAHCEHHNECRKPCVICCGEGTVDGRDHYDPLWDYEKYSDPFATCTSCGGSGLAKDMTWC